VITIGIDPHKSSLTAVALEPSGEVSATIRLEVNRDTVARLLAWARQWPHRRWAVECAAGLGRGVAQGLAAADEPVVDVPAQPAARARLLDTGHARKTDPIDAAAVAMVAQHHRRLHPVRAEDDSLVLRLLSERRDDLAGERTRTANRLHALLRDLIPGGAKRNLSADQAAALLRGVQPMTAADAQRKQLSRELVADLRRLDAALQRNSEDIAAVEPPQRHRAVDVEEVDREHAGGLGAQELPPCGVGAPNRCRWDPVALQDPPNRRGAPTRWPSSSSSPRIRWYPQRGFSVAIRTTSAATMSSIGGRPGRRCG
jgi:hypothetical protein